MKLGNILYNYKIEGETEFDLLSEGELSDIEFDNLFERLNYTTSPIGEQMLYYQIAHRSCDIGQLSSIEQKTLQFNDPSAARLWQKKSSIINNRDCYHILELLFREPVRPMRFKWVAFLLASISLLLTVAVFFHPSLLMFYVPLLFINAVIHYLNKNRVYLQLHALSGLKRLLTFFSAINRQGSPFNPNDETLRSFDKLKSLKTLLSKLDTDYIPLTYLLNDFGSIIWVFREYFRIITLSEVVSYHLFAPKVQMLKKEIEIVYNWTGIWDMAYSLKQFRDSMPYWCHPLFEPEIKTINTKHIYHPCIEDCVANDLFASRGMLVTGSNMAGKTTFLRTIAVNLLLAQRLNTVCANNWVSPYLTLGVSINNLDNLKDGKSYFFSEALSINRLINIGINGHGLLLTDELFKGTNIEEQTAASIAVLQNLNRNGNILFATTHNSIFVKFLENELDICHFQESIEGESIIFDYKLKAGPLTRTNALECMKLAGIPGVVIREAKQLLNVKNRLFGSIANEYVIGNR